MRIYVLAAVIGLVGAALLVGAAVIVHHQGEKPTAAAATHDDGHGGRGGRSWGRNPFPNVPLTTQDGERVHFYDDLVKGKVVTISFMYTSCPAVCPVETARLLQVAHLLGDRLGKDVFFYSITIDPEHDTQQVLKAYADRWQIPRGWTFLTGKRSDIIHLRKRLGMRLDDVASGKLSDHTVNLLIGNEATGLWMKRAPFENPYYLASQLGGWLHGFKLPPKEQGYGKAPELRQISDGEYVFRTHCSPCHTVGGGDVRNAAANQIGPDLFDITRRRERKWLERWLAEPDVMLAEKDPLATSLLAAYDDLPMPNLQLSKTDVTKILGYIEQESRNLHEKRSGKLGPMPSLGRDGHGAGEAPGAPAGSAQHADQAARVRP